MTLTTEILDKLTAPWTCYVCKQTIIPTLDDEESFAVGVQTRYNEKTKLHEQIGEVCGPCMRKAMTKDK